MANPCVRALARLLNCLHEIDTALVALENASLAHESYGFMYAELVSVDDAKAGVVNAQAARKYLMEIEKFLIRLYRKSLGGHGISYYSFWPLLELEDTLNSLAATAMWIKAPHLARHFTALRSMVMRARAQAENVCQRGIYTKTIPPKWLF